MWSPRVAQGPIDANAGGLERCGRPLDGDLGRLEDVLGDEDLERPPFLGAQVPTSALVLARLLTVLMPTTVVLEGQLGGAIAEVDPEDDDAVRVVDPDVDLRFWQGREHEEET